MSIQMVRKVADILEDIRTYGEVFDLTNHSVKYLTEIDKSGLNVETRDGTFAKVILTDGNLGGGVPVLLNQHDLDIVVGIFQKALFIERASLQKELDSLADELKSQLFTESA